MIQAPGQRGRGWPSGHLSSPVSQWGRRAFQSKDPSLLTCEPVWSSGKALGWQAEGPRFKSASALLSLQKLCVWTLSCDFVPHNYETLK